MSFTTPKLVSKCLVKLVSQMLVLDFQILVAFPCRVKKWQTELGLVLVSTSAGKTPLAVSNQGKKKNNQVCISVLITCERWFWDEPIG